MNFEKNNPRILNAWCMYDWANSVHSLTIVSAIFPIYFNSTAVSAQGGDVVPFWGMEVKNSALFSYTISAAFLTIAFLSPFFTAIADFSGQKKAFMRFFVTLGSLSCLGLYFFRDLDTLPIGVLAFWLSLIGWSGSIVFYNSYLPDIATEDRFDQLSAKGFSMGYLGSVLLLIFNLLLLLKPEWFGHIQPGVASRWAFVSVGLWWFLFSLIPLYYLPKNLYQKKPKGSWIFNGFRELKKVWHQLGELPVLKRFLLAFFCYNLGAQTFMYLGTMFGTNELHLPDTSLIITILILQILAIAGAYLAAKSSQKFGNKKALMVLCSIWAVISFCAYWVTTEAQFYFLAASIGLVMGAIQSLSRSTYSKIMPETEDTASFFSFYDICDKVSTFLGTLIFGLITDWTNSMRTSILVLIFVFLLGTWLLRFVSSKKIQPIGQRI
jgi:MFS transporter, UMF1 family